MNAMKHMETHQAHELGAMVNWLNKVTSFHWITPMKTALRHLLDGYKSGILNGDPTMAMWDIHFYAEYAFFSGTNLDLLHKDVTMYSIEMVDYSAIKHLHCHESIHQLILNHRVILMWTNFWAAPWTKRKEWLCSIITSTYTYWLILSGTNCSP